MKTLLTSVAVLATAAMMLTTPATSQTAGSGQANPPAASGPSGSGAGPGPGSGHLGLGQHRGGGRTSRPGCPGGGGDGTAGTRRHGTGEDPGTNGSGPPL